MLNVSMILLSGLFFLNFYASDKPEKITKKRTYSALECSDKSSNVRDVKRIKTEASTQKKFEFIYDQYMERRGAPAMLAIHCSNCKAFIMDYQKDGPGRLLRCYLDRIHAPGYLKNRQNQEFDIAKFYNLGCTNCVRVIGTPMIYEPEDRPAYKMVKERFYFVKK